MRESKGKEWNWKLPLAITLPKVSIAFVQRSEREDLPEDLEW
jgi:hypothetical protein